MTRRPGIEYDSARPICNFISRPRRRQGIPSVKEAKNTARALVRIGFDGRVHKSFRAADAKVRFENELRVLLYLQERGCEFVPRVLSYDRDKLELVTTNCGARVEQMSDEKMKSLFAELESYGVRHEDPFLRNITYRATDGRFCIIDFEFATILDEAAVATEPAESPRPQPDLILRWSAITDRGKFRANNEDAFLVIAFNPCDFHHLAKNGEIHAKGLDFIFAVSDGMGGERSGEFASKSTADNIVRLLPRRFLTSPAHCRAGMRDCLDEVFQGIHRTLTTLGRSNAQIRGMGATLSLIWLIDDVAHIGHIGDSRVYHLPAAGGIKQVTEDHSHVGWLRRTGQINEREARNHPRKSALSQALGAGNQFIRPQFCEMRCEPGDRFLLCTDGVVDGLWDRGLEDLLRHPPKESTTLPPAERIVRAAVDESGRDNATAIVVEVLAAQS